MSLLSLVLTFSISALILISALGFGQAIFQLFPHGLDILELLFFSMAFGIGFIAWIMFLLALAGLWYPVAAWALIAAGFLCLIISFRKGTPFFQWNLKKDSILHWISNWRNFPLIALILIILGSAIWILLTHALMPPLEWDEISYHLALPKLYIQNHRFIYVPYIVHANWPLLTDLSYGLPLMLGSDVAHHVVNLSATLIAAFGLFVYSVKNLRGKIGIIVVALFLTMPIVKRLSGTGLVDISLTIYSVAVFLAYQQWKKTRSNIWLLFVGIFAALTASTKLIHMSIPILFGILWFWDQIHQPGRKLKSFLMQAAMLFIPLAVIIGPWFLRSYLLTGNPVWPFLFNLFGGRNWDIIGDQYHNYSLHKVWAVDISSNLVGLARSVFYFLFSPQKLGGYVGVGLVVGLLFISGILFLPKSPAWLKELFFLSFSEYIIWFFLGSRQIRFLSPIFPYLCLIAGYAVDRILNRFPAQTWQVAGIAIVALILLPQFPFFNRGERYLLFSRWLYINGDVSREKLLTQMVRTLPTTQYINHNLPENARVLLLPFETRGYYLDRDYMWGNPFAQRMIRFEQFNSPEDLADYLRFLGITHILENPEWMNIDIPTWEHDRQLMLDLENKCGDMIFSKYGVKLFTLAQCRS